MNKDFEKEYKDLMTEDVPDLWARIETELEPRKPAVKNPVWKKYHVWGLAAAACLCLAVVTPMILGQISGGSRGESSNNGMADLSAPMADMLDGNMTKYEGATSNMSPQENYDMEYDGADSAGETIMDRHDDEAAITAKVIEVFNGEDEAVCLVELVESDQEVFLPGERIRLHGTDRMREELTEGEIYWFEILISKDNSGFDEYDIFDFRKY